MKRILVPCDFSQSAQSAYTFALDIAKKNNAEVFVVKAIDFPFMYEASFDSTSPYFVDPALIQTLENDARESYKKMKSEHTRQEDISFEVLQGPVTPSIREYISRRDIDLVVMGTNGATGLTGYIIGSNTEKIVRVSPVPVMAVRKAVKLASIRNIVFPTSLENNQTELVAKVKELQAFFDAKLHLLHINTLSNFWSTTTERSEMDNFIKVNKLTNCTANYWNDYHEQDGILQFCKEIGGDMIAMATHGRRGLSHLFNGSLAEEIVNTVDVPIWTFSLKKPK